jgi:phenylacetate-CoA ligase
MSSIDTLHARFVTSVSFPLSNYLYNRRFVNREYAELLRLERATKEQIGHYQLEKLRERLTYAEKRVPFYRRRFAEIGFDPRDVKSLEDLRQLPALSRSDLVEHRIDLVDDRLSGAVALADGYVGKSRGQPIPFARWRKRKLVRHTSSGSTGEPVVSYEYGAKSAATWSFEKLFKDWYGMTSTPREARIAGFSTEFVPSGVKPMLRRLFWRQILLPGINLRECDYELIVNALNDYRPEVIWGLTSALRGLSEYMLEAKAKLRYRPLLIASWAERMGDYEEDLFRQALECPITNLYSSREVGHIACRCPERRFHVDQRHLIVEVDQQSTAIAERESGEVIVTTLFDSPMPFIRYRMGDIGEVDESTCPCGRNLQVLHKVEGRTYEVYTTRDGRMIGPNFWLALFHRDYLANFIKRFQVIYKRDDSILIKFIRRADRPEEPGDALRNLIDSNLGGQTPFQWQFVDRIEPEPSGKVPIVKYEK